MMNISFDHKMYMPYLLSMVILLLFGCTTPTRNELANVCTSEFIQNRKTKEIAGLKVAIDPMLEPQRVLALFGTDLLAEGIVPIHIAVQNNSKDTIYFLPSSSFYLISRERGYIPRRINPFSSNLEDESFRQSRRSLQDTKVYLVGTFFVSPLFASPIAGHGIYLQREAHNKLKKAQLVNLLISELELQENTILPNHSHFGMVYFKLGFSDSLEDILMIRCSARILKESSTIDFDFQVGEQK